MKKKATDKVRVKMFELVGSENYDGDYSTLVKHETEWEEVSMEDYNLLCGYVRKHNSDYNNYDKPRLMVMCEPKIDIPLTIAQYVIMLKEAEVEAAAKKKLADEKKAKAAAEKEKNALEKKKKMFEKLKKELQG